MTSLPPGTCTFVVPRYKENTIHECLPADFIIWNRVLISRQDTFRKSPVHPLQQRQDVVGWRKDILVQAECACFVWGKLIFPDFVCDRQGVYKYYARMRMRKTSPYIPTGWFFSVATCFFVRCIDNWSNAIFFMSNYNYVNLNFICLNCYSAARSNWSLEKYRHWKILFQVQQYFFKFFYLY